MKRTFAWLLFLLFFIPGNAQFHNWPMWRYDYNRSAATPEQLPDKLYLQWQVTYSERTPVWDDPLNQNLMQFDRIFEPIVADGKIFVGFNDQDKVIALDVNTGKELWHYYADGPVRLPIAYNNGKVYFTGDDGFCYCLDAASGKQVWKKLLAPASNKLLGNKRLISMWPARGGIVIRDNVLYTSASIFPMMGTFIYAIDAETGNEIWKNDGTASNYILQPHNSPAFADVAPQGAFTISGNTLLVAGGRTIPAGFDLKTGKELFYHLASEGKTGGAFTFANDKVYFNHHRGRMTWMYNTKTGERIKAQTGEYPVVDGNMVYFSGKNISAAVLTDDNNLKNLWKLGISATHDLIKAGNCLYASDSTGITAVRIDGDKPERLWTITTERPAERLLASHGKLISVTADGRIMVYGDKPVKPVSVKLDRINLKVRSSLGDRIIVTTGIDNGYALVFGTKDLGLLKYLAAATSLNVVVFDKDPSRVDFLRNYFDKAGVPAGKMAFLQFEPGKTSLPKYFSSLTIINDPEYINDFDKDEVEKIYESTRPYGGTIWLAAKSQDQKLSLRGLDLYGKQVTEGKDYVVITRSGPLEGSASWTHNYGDIANTVKSDDRIVKAPLGILWFGGNSNMDVLPRHGHGPSEQVIDGKLIIQGINSLTARDVYTGRLLWKKEFEGLKDDTWLIYYDESYDEENPLDTKTNQEHLPGANARGTNFIATKEFVYAIESNKCHVIDMNTGTEIHTFTTGDASTRKLGYIGVYKNFLILGNNFTDYPDIPLAEGEKPNPKFDNYDVTASRELIVLDRFTGNKIWSVTANHGFIHNSVIAGDDILFCLDKLPQNIETRLRRRGEEIPGGQRLLYIDIKTGKKIYEETKNVFGTWLGYSSEYKLLLQATRPSRDMLNGEDGKRMIVYKTGSREVLWDKPVKYLNPPIIANDKIYTNGEGFYLLTGEPITEKDPLTGEDLKWGFKREYGCGYVIASEHLLTFRSASAGFVNLDVFEGTGSLGGFKAGCSANLIVADGVLNSPDYTRTCNCPYQNQTSLALVNMPWMTYWTNSDYKWSGRPIRKLGINLNAPGDRTSSDDVLWLDFPNAGGTNSGLKIKMDSVDYYTIRKDPVTISSKDSPWISASAIAGIRTMNIRLSKEKAAETTYRIRLFFAELENRKTGERIMDVRIQGKDALKSFDIVSEAGRPDKEVIKTFSGVHAGADLSIELIPVKGNTILSGVEIVQETFTEK
jgi:outer membrane protein assembly factor BamB